jgi:methionyl-tRNA formyltransferase
MSARPELRTVFFGNSESVFSNRHFAALAASSCQVAAVVDVPPAGRTTTNTRPQTSDPSFVDAARDRDIAVYEPSNPNQPEFVATIRSLQPDLFLAVGYTRLLKDDLLAVPEVLAANFHASLLPAYRGKHPLFWALRHGERWAGLTVHVMAPGFDTGDILYQVRLRTRRRDSVGSLYDRIMERSVRLVPRLVADAAARTLHRQPQGEVGASYFSSVAPDDFRLDWTQPAALLSRWVCASPSQCYFDFAGQRIHVLNAEPESGPAVLPAGAIASIGRICCTVATGQGHLRVQRIRAQDRAAQPAAAWCRDVRLRPGVLLTG